ADQKHPKILQSKGYRGKRQGHGHVRTQRNKQACANHNRRLLRPVKSATTSIEGKTSGLRHVGRFSVSESEATKSGSLFAVGFSGGRFLHMAAHSKVGRQSDQSHSYGTQGQDQEQPDHPHDVLGYQKGSPCGSGSAVWGRTLLSDSCALAFLWIVRCQCFRQRSFRA